MAQLSTLERAQTALEETFHDQIATRFAAFNGWITMGAKQAALMNVADPDAMFERDLQQLKSAYGRAQKIIDKVFGEPSP